MNSSPAAPDSSTTVDQNRWFVEEVQPHDSQLKAYVRGAFPSVRDVDDVVQESYLRVWKARAASSVPGSASSVVMVDAGKRVVVKLAPQPPDGGAPEVQVMSAAELEQRLAWRIPRLSFSDTPLVEAIRMFNEHAATRRNIRLVLSDPALGNLQLSGVLRADNIESLLRLLEREFGIEAVERGNEIVLRKFSGAEN